MTTQNLLSSNDFGSAWPSGEEEFLDRDNEVRWFIRSASPVAAPRARVIGTHGLGEHSNRFGHVAAELVARGYRVVAWDLRGHGRSTGVRGDVQDYGHLLEDLGAVRERYMVPGLPLFLYGHSLGGQITLRYLETTGVDCRGAIAASPWLRLAFTPPWWKLALAKLAMRLWPSFVQPTGHHWQKLSRDFTHLSTFPDLDLVHHGISARMYFAVRTAGEQALAEAGGVRVPLFLLHGDADPVTSHRSTCEFFERVGSEDKTLRIFPENRHETHNDLDRAQVIGAIGDWIEGRLK
jgi:alpha-beta hydrolase superfamily lysophospholipase